MTTQSKKYVKLSSELEIGDNIEVGELLCTVKKVEDVFHHTPKNRVRISLTIVGADSKREAILFLPQGIAITTLQ